MCCHVAIFRARVQFVQMRSCSLRRAEDSQHSKVPCYAVSFFLDPKCCAAGTVIFTNWVFGLTSELLVLRPPSESFCGTPRSTRSRMSRKAVSCKHLAILAHLLEVSLPSSPSWSWFNAFGTPNHMQKHCFSVGLCI